MSATTQAANRNTVLTVAKGTQETIRMAETADPDLAGFLKGKSLLASKSPWGTIAASGVGWLIAHYGLACSAATVAASGCWSPDTVTTVEEAATVAGAFVGAYIMRLVTKTPITGVLTPAPVAPVAPSA